MSSAIEPTHPEWLQGGGEMGALIRSRDWSKGPLGPLASWPATLRTMVRLALDSARPAAIAWGPSAIHLYNDAYRRLGASGHPGALGQPFGACAEPARVALAAPLRAALAGEPRLLERQRLLVDRGEGREEALVTFSFDPVRDGEGEVAGALVVAQETVREAPAEGAAWVENAADPLYGALDAARIGTWELDLTTRVARLSRTLRTIFGYADASKPWTYELFLAHVHPDDRARVASAFEGAVAAERDWSFECDIVRVDGTAGSIWAYGNIVRNGAGRPERMFGVVADITERKQAERLLRETEARFHSTFDRMLEGCQIVAFDWRYLYLNESAARQNRRAVHELVGRTMLETYPGIEGTEVFRELRRCMTDRISHRMETRFDFPDGVASWFDISIQPSPEGIFILSIDVTDRKLSEATLQQSDARYRRIVETAQEGIWELDPVGTTTFVNAKMAEILGRTRDEMVGAPVFDFMGPEARAVAAENIERRAQGLPEQHDFKFHRKDGTEVWVLMNTNPVQDAAGNCTGALAMATDITERKKSENALRESDERFRQLAESLPQLVWTCDADGRCDFLSRQWAEYTDGGKPGGLLWLDLVHDDDRPALDAGWRAAVAAASELRADFRLRRRDGTYRWFETLAVPVFSRAGPISKWVGSNTDVTERRQAQEARLRIQKMEALGTLAGGIAHDFNNILAAIEGNARLAIADLPVDHPAQESLSEIEKSGARAVDIVRRILSFSRHQEPNRDVIDLAPAIEEALGLLRATLPVGVEVRAEFAPDVAPTIADPTEVHQVVVNLVTNASHAIGSRGGRIDLRLDTALVASTEDDAIAGLRPGRYARLTVTDDGSGMDKETSDRIFDPFFTTKPVGQGTGLGLSLVHGVVKSTGGMVTVDSQLGAGTTFRLYFPAAEGAPRVARTAPPDDVRPHRGRILYVDDERALVKLITRGLRRMGYVVTGFTEPALALEWARAQPNAFDVAVTDLSMPGMSGFDLARELLALRPTLPVVMITGFARAEDYAAAAEAGVSALILKPSTVEQLASELRRFFLESIDVKKGSTPA